jgi:integrase
MNLRLVDHHGNKRWRLDLGKIKGKRHVKFFKTKAAAETAILEAKDAKSVACDRWLSMSSRQREHVMMIVNEIEQAGLDIGTVWATFKAEKLRPTGMSVTLESAINELLVSKRTSNRRERYIKSLSDYLRLFARGREKLLVDRIRAKDIEEWFAGRREALTTRKSNLGRLSALFSLCVRRGYITSNPCDEVERPYIDGRPPAILTPMQIAKALAYTRRKEPKYLAWLVLAMLCGLRPEEASKARWKDIDLSAGTIMVDAIASKVRFRRIVHPMPMAVAWLECAKQLKSILPIGISSRRRFLRRLRARLGFTTWPQDCLRHSAATYWLAEVQDAGKVANELGTSANILLKHYRELVTREQARRVWAMLPYRVRHPIVVPLTATS